MLLLLDTQKNKIGNIADYKDLKLEREINKLDILSFSISRNDPAYEIIQEEYYIRNNLENEYVIKQINISEDDYKEVVCEVNVEELKGTLIDNINQTQGNCEATANLAMVNTTWHVGYCDVIRKRNIIKKQCSVYDVLQEIQSMYHCEIAFNAINKEVLIYQSIGSDKGTYFSDELNLRQLNLQSDTNDYVTQIIPIGANNLTIESANNGDNYVSNYQYTKKILKAYWVDNRYTIAQDLKDDATERLSELSKPKKSYSVSIADLANLSEDYKILDYGLGDSITLLSKNKRIKDNQRIKKLEIYPEEPEKNTAEVSNTLENVEDLIKRFDNTSDTVEQITNSDNTVTSNAISSVDWTKVTNVSITSAQIGNAQVGTLQVADASITNAKIDRESVNKLVVTNADIQDATIEGAKIKEATITSANIQDEAVNESKINHAFIDKLDSTYATIKNLDVASANVDNLKVSVGTIMDLTTNTLKSQIITADNIKTNTITAGSGIIAQGAIGSAEISELDASLIRSGKLDTSLITVVSGDNHLNITGSKIQFFDTDSSNKLFERICIGDVNGDKSDYGMVLRAKNGTTTLFDVDGITKEGFTDGYGKLDNNSLDPKKIDIEKVVTSINGAVTKIDGSSITVDNQTLSARFSSITENLDNMQIGGTNVLRNTAFNGLDHWGVTGVQGCATVSTDNKYNQNNSVCINITGATSNVYGGISQNLSNQVIPGETYVLSFYLMCPDLSKFTSDLRIYFPQYDTSNNLLDTWAQVGDIVSSQLTQGVWKKYVYPIKFNSAFKTANLNIDFSMNGLVYLNSLKLEKGNKTTDWSPSPLDIESSISSVSSQVTETANAIGFNLNTQTWDTTDNYSSFKDIQTFIQANHGKITSSVSETDIEASIGNINIGINNLIHNGNFLKGAIPGSTTAPNYWGFWGNPEIYGEQGQGPYILTGTLYIGHQIYNSGISQELTDILEPNTTYTIVFNSSKESVNGVYNQMEYYDSNKNCIGTTKFDYDYSKPNTPQSFTFTTPASFVAVDFAHGGTAQVWRSGYLTSIGNVVLVEGTKAPSSFVYNLDDIQKQIDQNTSTISQQANLISTKVDVNGVISTIQQNPTSVQYAFNQINSAMIQIDGAGLHIGNGGIEIKNKSGNIVFNTDSNGDLNMRGTLSQYDSNGQISTDIRNNAFNCYDWKSSGNFVGSLTASESDDGHLGVAVYSDNGDELYLGNFVGSAGRAVSLITISQLKQYPINFNGNMDLHNYNINNPGNLVQTQSDGFINYIRMHNGSNGAYMEVANVDHLYGINVWNSDISFKYAIADSTENALDIINRFKHRQFHWKEDGRHQELGYVSQELYAINPALVLSVPQKNGTVIMQPRDDMIIPYLSKSIQEEDAKVEQLKSKIISLENRILMLENQNKTA
ncbi:phage minor structural protein [Clostridium acetobutylicum]|uniref:Uncharacterized, phage-related protein n=2 Tax=Clostridium acetobutylicum TaxID=1488 RepID=Q97HX7_CLOAB|nr:MULTISPECIES: phage tail spike protein [Clostridium]AAK79843.1 Uncharacterized, phage-related protein [Clostridium acetobutylicum ATCC 824]ADZ20929.1 Conserved hypothetical protein [Clostridium acetobutylicum EA 2018]AEI32020.1 hypothetical protein SMB_G1904 [Clostridium acetobutylicum DSM 1731]AWV79727.1 hypothetical protein DK921_06365 [Clostridium acetobutylicum]MBC2394295.1 hypothetical protein [Clostridium acetobutylicum]